MSASSKILQKALGNKYCEYKMYKQPTTWLLQEKKQHFFFSFTFIYYSNIENFNEMVTRLFFQVTQTCILTAKFSPA